MLHPLKPAIDMGGNRRAKINNTVTLSANGSEITIPTSCVLDFNFKVYYDGEDIQESGVGGTLFRTRVTRYSPDGVDWEYLVEITLTDAYEPWYGYTIREASNPGADLPIHWWMDNVAGNVLMLYASVTAPAMSLVVDGVARDIYSIEIDGSSTRVSCAPIAGGLTTSFVYEGASKLMSGCSRNLGSLRFAETFAATPVTWIYGAGVTVASDGRTVVLKASENITGGSATPGAFLRRPDGTEIAISSATYTGDELTIVADASEKIYRGEIVLAGYGSAAGTLTTASGDLPDFPLFPVVNLSTQSRFVSAAVNVDGDELEVNFTDDIGWVDVEKLRLNVNGTPATLGAISTTGSQKILSVSPVVESGDTLTLDILDTGAPYEATLSVVHIDGTVVLPVAAQSGLPVTNGSAVGASSASFVTIAGDSLILQITMPTVSTGTRTAPYAGYFTVYKNGSPVSILAPPMGGGVIVTGYFSTYALVALHFAGGTFSGGDVVRVVGSGTFPQISGPIPSVSYTPFDITETALYP